MTWYPGKAWVGVGKNDTKNDSTSSKENIFVWKWFVAVGFSRPNSNPLTPFPSSNESAWKFFLVCNLMTFLFSSAFFYGLVFCTLLTGDSSLLRLQTSAQTSVADFIIESIYDLQGKVNDERVNSPIKNLRKRFDDVCSWTSYIVLSQLLPDERRAAFGCLLRVAITCWNIGNFIGAKEIITGLR